VQHQVIVVFGNHIFLFNERVPLEDGKGISNARIRVRPSPGTELTKLLKNSFNRALATIFLTKIEFDVTLFAVTTSPARTKKDAIPANWIPD
jgi:hypothetical protein